MRLWNWEISHRPGLSASTVKILPCMTRLISWQREDSSSEESLKHSNLSYGSFVPIHLIPLRTELSSTTKHVTSLGLLSSGVDAINWPRKSGKEARNWNLRLSGLSFSTILTKYIKRDTDKDNREVPTKILGWISQISSSVFKTR